ncbi:imm11 family protein [Caulobacter mirabilis]|uniref:Immunity MXAN-0049 protein domain-containing protein n=1 Tax=Caulobacter mirabilis TaxID=69666 RepID=A0A2D2B1S0_9CAUL|nr:DUF1629 domain-containing protein [Caulobacter mirabilis]ATQ44200.1 hypothetical protein CSW64_18315 [Caulobacter mirabilis]
MSESDNSAYLIQMKDRTTALFDVRDPQATYHPVQTRSFGDVNVTLDALSWTLPWETMTSLASRPSPALTAYCVLEPDRPLPDLLQDSNGVHFVSDRLKVVVEPLMKDCEFLPVEVTHIVHEQAVATIREGYWWMNCWRRIDCVDWEQSDAPAFSLTDPPRMNPAIKGTGVWKRLVLKPIDEDEHFFGLLGMFGGRRYLSATLMQTIRAAGLPITFMPQLLDQSDVDTANRLHFDIYMALNPWGARK